MTEFDIQRRLFDTFLTLDSFAISQGYTGEPYFVKNGDDEIINVHFPNIPFDYPESKRWFDVTFKSNDPTDLSCMGIQNRFNGVLYIDIMTPQDVGEYESEAIYRWVAKLFNAVNIDVIDIMKVYISTKGNEADHYRLQVAIEWEADIDKE